MAGSQNDTAHCVLHLVMCLEFLKQNTPQLVKEQGMGATAGQYVTGVSYWLSVQSVYTVYCIYCILLCRQTELQAVPHKQTDSNL